MKNWLSLSENSKMDSAQLACEAFAFLGATASVVPDSWSPDEASRCASAPEEFIHWAARDGGVDGETEPGSPSRSRFL